MRLPGFPGSRSHNERKELREREVRDRELRDRELRNRELRNRELRNRELRDRELRDHELRVHEREQQNLLHMPSQIHNPSLRPLPEHNPNLRPLPEHNPSLRPLQEHNPNLRHLQDNPNMRHLPEQNVQPYIPPQQYLPYIQEGPVRYQSLPTIQGEYSQESYRPMPAHHYPPHPSILNMPSQLPLQPVGSLPPTVSPTHVRPIDSHITQRQHLRHGQGISRQRSMPVLGGAASSPSSPRDLHSPGITPISVGGNKRLLRQRRRDPSCDACRERKVKCDATDSSPCSECMSRDQKCQFTKDSNRRMSSTRQVKDLERSLKRAMASASQFRDLLVQNGIPIPELVLDTDTEEEIPHSIDTGDQWLETDQRPKSALEVNTTTSTTPVVDLTKYHQFIVEHDLMVTQNNTVSDNKEIMLAYNSAGWFDSKCLDRKKADSLLQVYYHTYHSWFPVIDWTEFTLEYERLDENSLARPDHSWMATFYAVLALGMRFSDHMDPPRNNDNDDNDNDNDNKEQVGYSRLKLIQLSRDSLDLCPANDNHSGNMALGALLLTLCMNETNCPIAATTWLSISFGFSQTPLNRSIGNMISTHRLRWGITVMDRLLGVEFDLNFTKLMTGSDSSHALTLPRVDSLLQMNEDNVVESVDRLFRFCNAVLRKISTSTLIPVGSLQTFSGEFDSISESLVNKDFKLKLGPLMMLQFFKCTFFRLNLTSFASRETDLRQYSLLQIYKIAMECVNVFRNMILHYEGKGIPWKEEARKFSVTRCSVYNIWGALIVTLIKENYGDAAFLVRILEFYVETMGYSSRSFGLYIQGEVEYLSESYQNLDYSPEQDETIYALVSLSPHLDQKSTISPVSPRSGPSREMPESSKKAWQGWIELTKKIESLRRLRTKPEPTSRNTKGKKRERPESMAQLDKMSIVNIL